MTVTSTTELAAFEEAWNHVPDAGRLAATGSEWGFFTGRAAEFALCDSTLFAARFAAHAAAAGGRS